LKITAEEIDARIKQWKDQGTGRIRVLCRVRKATRGGLSEPLANAEVKFVPEDFWARVASGHGHDRQHRNGLILQPKQGESDTAPGMSPGFYRVEITKGTEIPAKYNTETILGQEVATDVAGISSRLVFELKY